MEILKATFKERKTEIFKLLSTMKFLEQKEQERYDGITAFKVFFDSDEELLGYQELINILKSNVSLMIYNIIEFTVSNLLEAIYTEIKTYELSYVDVNDDLKGIWRKARIKAINSAGINHDSFIKINESMIQEIVENKTLEISYRNVLRGGNLDGEGIRELFYQHGIKTTCKNYRPDILKNVKNKRNELAHGSVSFVDALRDKVISDIEESSKIIVKYLEELIDVIQNFINNGTYRAK